MSIYSPPTNNAIQKTLGAQLLSGVTAAATLNNVVGIPNEPGIMVVDRVDSSGNSTASLREYIAYTGTSGSTVTGLTRNVDSGGTDQDHAVGAVVEFVFDVVQAKAIKDTFETEHNADGTHDTTKVVDLTTAQTLTNKTLTSPLLKGTIDGWISANETWTYASASTITVPSGAASKYSIGDSIRWKQGGAYKYGVISAVADTLLTIIVNTDYTVATPTAITDNYYTHSPTAVGLPAYYNFTPSWSNITVGAGTNAGRYKTNGRFIQVQAQWIFGASAAVSIDAKFNFPVTPVTNTVNYFGNVMLIDNSADLAVYGKMRYDGYLKYDAVSGSLLSFSYLQATSPFTWATNDSIVLMADYFF